jgi:hypothetical protein
MNVMLPAHLPDIARAQLPKVYEDAKRALSECARVDECKKWSDKAAALASYAKQQEDESLFRFATRIKARAIRRAGAILLEIQPASGRQKEKRDAPPRFSRTQAATDAGLSDDQRKTALRVAKVSAADFEAAIEGDEPATIESLADLGTKKKDFGLGDDHLAGRTPEEFAMATKLMGAVEHISRRAKDIDIALGLRGIAAGEMAKFLADIEAAYRWLDAIRKEIWP